MDPETAREHRRIATEEAAAALAERRDESRRRAAGPPRAGDTFLLRPAAAYPVEWLLVERRDRDAKLLAVPLDDFPFAGSRDVELPARAVGGTSIVRCDLGVWLDAEVFEADLRTGAVPAGDLERVRDKRRAVLGRELSASLAEAEVDADPEYRKWRESTLRPALDALTGAPVKSELRRAEGALRKWAVPLALAASAVVAVRLFNGQETRLLRDALEAERARAEERQARIEELTAALAAEPQVNLPLIELQGGERERGRLGDAYPAVLPPEVKRVALAIEVEDPEYYPRYRLRIVVRPAAELIWQTDELVKEGRWLRLDVPAAFFESGKEYELRIEGRGQEDWIELEERYLVEVRR